jgi:hypothetical protein
MLSTSNLMLNPNHATIYFKCKFRTRFGQTLRVVGNIEELGCWDPSKSMPMNTNSEIYPVWESNMEIPGPVGMEIFYKYVIHDEHINSYTWEKLERDQNRKFTIPSSGIFILNDEEGSVECHVHKVIGGDNSIHDIDLSDDMGGSYSFFEDENKRKMLYDSTLEIYNTLSYDSNQLNGNDLNETFLFCLNQKISSEDRIIIASAFLPVEVNRLPDDTFSIKLTDESSIYSILYGMKEKHICEVVWVGMLKNFSQFTETELNKILETLQENNMYMIPVTETEYRNYWIYINKILGPVFISSTINVNW